MQLGTMGFGLILMVDRYTDDDIRRQIGFNESQVKKIMKSNLKPRSYKVWRERVRWIKEKHKNNRTSLFKE
jgi:uncharacterized protein (TIGR03643 family)